MSNRPFKPANLPQLFPYMVVKDGEKAIEFYESAFGFTLCSPPVKDEQGKIQHAEMSFGEAVIMFAPEESWAQMGPARKTPATLGVMPSLSFYLYCEDVDALYKKAMANGATSAQAPNDAFWGDRCCNLIDPDGHDWMFATNVTDHK